MTDMDEPTREEREREIDWPAPDEEENATRSDELRASVPWTLLPLYAPGDASPGCPAESGAAARS